MCVCSWKCNEEAFQHYGKNLVKVVTEQVRHNQRRFNQFQAILHEKVKGLQLADKAVLSVYTEFSQTVPQKRAKQLLLDKT